MPELDNAVLETPAPEGTPEQTPAPASAPTPANPVFERILETQTKMAADLAALRPQATPAQPASTPSEPGASSDADLESAARALFGDDPDGFDEPIDVSKVVGLISQASAQAAKEAAAAAVQPFMQQRQVDSMLDSFDALEERLTGLQDPDTQKAVIERAAQTAERLGNPDLMFQPDFIELAYTAHVGSQGAGESAAPAPVSLESAAGATPEAGVSDESEAAGDAIVNAGRADKFGWGMNG